MQAMVESAVLHNKLFTDKLMEEGEKARFQGHTVTFQGEFRQSPKELPYIQLRQPFVIAQTQEQIEKLAVGILEGRVYDSDLYANIEGAITREKASFEKLYDEGSVEDRKIVRERIRAVSLEIGIPANRDKYLANPNIIKYEGLRSGDPEQFFYAGLWRFNSKDLDMEQEGMFKMEMVNDGARKLIA